MTRTCLILVLLSVSYCADRDEICNKVSTCGEDSCYSTCDNPCECSVSDNGEVISPVYGGRCQDTGFCESEFLSLDECIENGGSSCPRMVGEEELLDTFSQYDFRVDVRSDEEWEEGHANISIHTSGLAVNPTRDYLEQLAGKEGSRIVVYCKSGRRAFSASQNLLRYGFSNVHSYYHGGFPNLQARIQEVSERDENHPTKNFCYISGGSDICPTPLPRSHVHSAEQLRSLGDNVQFVDVRPLSYKKSFDFAARVPANKKKYIKKFLRKVDKDATLITFCNEGTFAFKGAKALKKYGWEGPVYFYDNGGYKDLKKLFKRA